MLKVLAHAAHLSALADMAISYAVEPTKHAAIDYARTVSTAHAAMPCTGGWWIEAEPWWRRAIVARDVSWYHKIQGRF